MINLAQDAAEAAEVSAPETGDGPKYPYGLCLCLNDDTLQKLGIGLPDVGQKVVIHAIATVTRASAVQEQDGGTEIGADLQITDMEISGAAGKTIASRLYSDTDA
jgi:hypothetical protein